MGLRVLHRSPGGLVVKVRGGTAVLRRCPGLWVASGLRVLNRSPGGLVVEAVEEVRREEVVEVVREVREVVEGVVDLRPSPPAANPAADTVSRPRPTPPTDSQAHGRHRPRPYAPMAVGRDRTSRISPPIGAAPAHAHPRRPSPALLDHGCSCPSPGRSRHRPLLPTDPAVLDLVLGRSRPRPQRLAAIQKDEETEKDK